MIGFKQFPKQNFTSPQFKIELIPKGATSYFEANPEVLVIEDDRLMREVFVSILDDIGFQVTVATNGVIALRKMQQRRPDFIISDILLPGMSAFEIYEFMQADPKTKNIPIMMVTAWGDAAYLYRAGQMGIMHFLLKPFTEDELLEEIYTLLVDSSLTARCVH